MSPSSVAENRSVWRFSGVARVDGVAVAEATYTAMIMTDPAP